MKTASVHLSNIKRTFQSKFPQNKLCTKLTNIKMYQKHMKILALESRTFDSTTKMDNSSKKPHGENCTKETNSQPYVHFNLKQM